MKKFLQQNSLYFAFGIALAAMMGSLYFSEIMKLPPCILCWYQRIALYPLVPILAIGIFKKDKTVVWYALPLAIIGLLISIYHNLLYYGIISESMQPCQLGVSCTTKFFEWFGFVTIPFLSLCAFVGVVVCLLLYKKRGIFN